MKIVAFIKEIDNNKGALPLKSFLKNETEMENREEVLAYLNKGKLCVPFMGIAEDADNELMGKIAVYTDGVWYWPEYFNAFLKKYKNFSIDPKFIEHVLNNQYANIELSEKEILELEKAFLDYNDFKKDTVE